MRSRGAWRLRATILGLLAALSLAACADGGAAGPPPSVPPHSTPAPVIPAPVPAAAARTFVPGPAPATPTRRGTCWTGSITVRSPHAFRCFADGQILDPCFAAPDGSSVVCYANPWTAGVRVGLAAALPKASPLALSHPWALQLANGARCVAATGVVGTADGVTLLYRCLDGGASGPPRQVGGHTQVEFVASGTHTARAVAVTVTWQA